MMVILLLLFLGSIQHSGSKPSTSNINMNNVKIKTKGSQHASAMTEQDTSGQCSIICTRLQSQFGQARKTLNCDGRKHDLSHCRTANAVPGDGPNGCTIVTCDGRKVDLSQNNPVSNDNDIRGQNGRNIDQNPNIQDFSGKLSKGQTIRDGQSCSRQPGITTMNWNGVCHRCRGTQHTRNNQVFCEGTEVDQNGRPIDQNQNNPVWPGNDIRGQNGRNIDQNPNVQDFSGQTIGDGQTFNQVQGPGGNQQCLNGVCHPCRGSQTIRNGKVICDGKQVGTIDQNQNNPVWTGNDIRGQTFRGQDINQDQTNGFNSNTVRQGGRNNDMNQNDLLGPGGKNYDNYDIKDWINWANDIKQLQLFEEKGGKPSAGGEKGGEP